MYFEKGDKNEGGEEEPEKNNGEDGEAGVEKLLAPYKAEPPKEHGEGNGDVTLQSFVLSHKERELKDGFGQNVLIGMLESHDGSCGNLGEL